MASPFVDAAMWMVASGCGSLAGEVDQRREPGGAAECHFGGIDDLRGRKYFRNGPAESMSSSPVTDTTVASAVHVVATSADGAKRSSSAERDIRPAMKKPPEASLFPVNRRVGVPKRTCRK
ncbi:hypothetical protein AB0E54_12505 [Amycolatopsis coloradensis]|uniref:hypothetical protein n=1 Tax=Amycolatopsis coloradensis TaxID=76021 RepID=UPI0011784ACB